MPEKGQSALYREEGGGGVKGGAQKSNVPPFLPSTSSLQKHDKQLSDVTTVLSAAVYVCV